MRRLSTIGRGFIVGCADWEPPMAIVAGAPKSLVGVSDLTDGKYVDDRNDRAAYLAAQYRQAEYLLDQVHCRSGTRLLDIGCGYGRGVEQAAARGAKAGGGTISPPQGARCPA